MGTQFLESLTTYAITMRVLAIEGAIPQLSITGATNADPIVITTSSTTNLETGMKVTIAGVGGNTNANGEHRITVIDSTTFRLNKVAGNAAYTSGGTIDANFSREKQYSSGTSSMGKKHFINWKAPMYKSSRIFVQLASDPTTTNKDIKIEALGMPTGDADWAVLDTVTQADTFTQDTTWQYTSAAFDSYPIMAIRVTAVSSSTNVMRAWIVAAE
tara:strand:- start:249 stop:893 length:645 start_codon:yes stop_codon:yes gene_type:complete